MPLDFSKKLQTRAGKPVRIICTDKKTQTFSEKKYVALVDHGGFEELLTYDEEGRLVYDQTSIYDLVYAPVLSYKYRIMNTAGEFDRGTYISYRPTMFEGTLYGLPIGGVLELKLENGVVTATRLIQKK